MLCALLCCRRPGRLLGLCSVFLLTAGLLLPGRPATAAGRTFFDGTFNDALWRSGALGTAPEDFVTAHIVGTGGNPDTYRQMELTAQPQYYKAFNYNDGWIWNPKSHGSITRIDYSLDVKSLSSQPKGYTGIFTLGLIQGQSFYEDNGQFAGAQASSSSWVEWPPFTGRTASDFIKIEGPGSEHPDFSASAPAIKFGYIFSGPKAGSVCGIDNFEVDINGGEGGGSDEGPNLTGSWQNPLIINCRPARGGGLSCTLEALTVANTGTAKAGGKTRKKRPKAAFFLSENASFGGKDVQIGTKTLDPLKAGASKRYVLTFKLPPGVDLSKASGKFLIAVLDSTHKVTEFNESDNIVISSPIP
jgi:hypothetical protein